LNDFGHLLEDLPPPLSPAFFERDTVTVARDLLGCRLLSFQPETGRWITCTIVETEAYTENDPACHAYGRRKTGRAEMLFRDPGLAYVYLIYGMYDCLNVVTEPFGTAGAVLFRALEPPSEYATGSKMLKTHGPGRLTKALGITRAAFNGLPLTQRESGLYLAAGSPVPEAQVVQTTRIGITKAAEYPWRFYVTDNPWVSVREKAERRQ
jgi:DNA-3-methyladenine glycosylase